MSWKHENVHQYLLVSLKHFYCLTRFMDDLILLTLFVSLFFDITETLSCEFFVPLTKKKNQYTVI